MPQNSQWANKTLKREINNIFISINLEINENGNAIYQKLLNAVKPVLRENIYSNKSYFKKQEKNLKKFNFTLQENRNNQRHELIEGKRKNKD